MTQEKGWKVCEKLEFYNHMSILLCEKDKDSNELGF